MNRGAYYKAKYGNKGFRGGGRGQKRSRDQHQQQEGFHHTKGNIEAFLRSIDGQGYGRYQSLENQVFTHPLYTLRFDKVQKDPFAPPSRMRIYVNRSIAGFPADLYADKETSTATSNYVLRRMSEELDKVRRYTNGGGFHDMKGGAIEISKPGQEILEQNSILIHEGNIEARLTFGLPGRGRTIASERAIEMLVHKLPGIVERSLLCQALDPDDLQNFVTCYRDQESLRKQLKAHDLVAFIPDGAILPRQSGISDLPMDPSQAAAFRSPDSLRTSITCQSKKKVSGMGIKCGVTMITGKSTLLSAIERGIYNHIPGDGREYLVCDPSLTRIRAEDGRSVEGTDISPFINNLPFGINTKKFSTANASGSTSMAANVQEMVEVGVRAMIYDEDTCATNFMIRDERMQMIVPKRNEPITPLIYKIRKLHQEKDISTILVVGSCGDYVDVSDNIIEMRNYEPIDITDHAKKIAAQYPRKLVDEGGDTYGSVTQRRLMIPAYTIEKRSVKAIHTVHFGYEHELSLSALENLTQKHQTQWIAAAIAYLKTSQQTKEDIKTLHQMIDILEKSLDGLVVSGTKPNTLRSPLDAVLQPHETVHGDFARPTRYQLAHAINRLRGIKVVE
ncbi:abc transporter atpase [Lichtheimia corymbifera JMRC:FSU:9682]|uniref:Abc transporter atpase n=1 Tax=Lichtheimia corymbifera JMRC:FSU:9682 TaxID=1263082 RepID=A0A068RRK7_9FUNG|nr:abc transporter atpase [Lichtheimia corymbifera JMRC:FSU:9682]